MFATAPAKLILCGEHAVVYGRPAIALPLAGIRARAEISDAAPGSGIVFDAPDLARRWSLTDAPDDPLSALVTSTFNHISSITHHASSITHHAVQISITSAIPIASGMGSGAAVATAIVRVLAEHFDVSLSPAEISALVYESERRLHGTPSGIDNTVIAWEQPVWFIRGQGLGVRGQGSGVADTIQNPKSKIQNLSIAAPFTLLIGDTGVRSATKLPVGAVRQRWQAEPARYDALFDAVGAVVARTRDALAAGDTAALGSLLNENHRLLQEIGVSSLELDALVGAARAAGATGAKLSGAGWGGVMLALVTPDTQERVAVALRAAGAVRVLTTDVAATGAA